MYSVVNGSGVGSYEEFGAFLTFFSAFSFFFFFFFVSEEPGGFQTVGLGKVQGAISVRCGI